MNSGPPLLPRVPERRPRGLNCLIVLSHAARQLAGPDPACEGPGCELSYLYIQQLLGRSSDKPVRRVLATLRGEESPEDLWLEVSSRSSLARGTRYRLGPAAIADRSVWENIGDQLTGVEGVLRPYLWTPASLPINGIGLNGCLVLGVVGRLGQIGEASLVRELDGYVARSSVRRKVSELVGLELIEKSDSGLRLPEGSSNNLSSVLRGSGADRRFSQIRRTVRRTQAEYQERVLGESSLRRYKSDLRTAGCIYCGLGSRPSGHVEHYPPVMWGGNDLHSLLLPSCGTCNTSLGGRLPYRTRRTFDPTTVDRIVFPGGADELLSFLVQLGAVCTQLQVAKASDGPEAALEAEFFAMLAAVRNGVEVVNSQTGEVTRAKLPLSVEWLWQQTADLYGLAVEFN